MRAIAQAITGKSTDFAYLSDRPFFKWPWTLLDVAVIAFILYI